MKIRRIISTSEIYAKHKELILKNMDKAIVLQHKHLPKWAEIVSNWEETYKNYDSKTLYFFYQEILKNI